MGAYTSNHVGFFKSAGLQSEQRPFFKKPSEEDLQNVTAQLQKTIQDVQIEFRNLIEKLAFRYNFRPEDTWALHLTYVSSEIDKLTKKLEQTITKTAGQYHISENKVAKAFAEGFRATGCSASEKIADDLTTRFSPCSM